MTCLGATVIVGAAVLSRRLAGPEVAGAVAAFPTMCTTLGVLAVLHDGPTAGVHILGGLVRSLPCYLVFSLVVAWTAASLGLAAVSLGLLAGLVTAGVTWRRVPNAAAPALDAPA